MKESDPEFDYLVAVLNHPFALPFPRRAKLRLATARRPPYSPEPTNHQSGFVTARNWIDQTQAQAEPKK